MAQFLGKRCARGRVERGGEALLAAGLLLLVLRNCQGPLSHDALGLRAFAGGCSRLPSATSQIVLRAEPQAIQTRATLDLIKAQSQAGHTMKELGMRLRNTKFEAGALDGAVKVTFDGHQALRDVQVAEGALKAAGGSNDALTQALLTALQAGHDSSYQGTKGDVWNLYQQKSELIQAPLTQIGAGNTVEDLWINVVKTDETVRMSEEMFAKFDVDKDGYWNLAETSKVQMATEGTDMTEEAFNALIIAAAPEGGRKLTEEDLNRGLSKEQVVELYTDATRQRQLGFVLDVFKDHKKIFESPQEEPDAEKSEGGEAAAAMPPSLD